jgi:hypothetical protein
METRSWNTPAVMVIAKYAGGVFYLNIRPSRRMPMYGQRAKSSSDESRDGYPLLAVWAKSIAFKQCTKIDAERIGAELHKFIEEVKSK